MANPKFSTVSDEIKQEWMDQFYKLTLMFKELGYDTFLNGGTLLGYCRNKQLIPQDDDFDFGVLIHSHDKQGVIKEWVEIHKYFESKNLRCNHNHIIGQNHFFAEQGKRHFDAFAVWTEGWGLYWSWAIHGELEDSALLPLKPISFYNHNFYIPNNYNAVLSKIYGSEWRIPSDTKPPFLTKLFFNKERIGKYV